MDTTIEDGPAPVDAGSTRAAAAESEDVEDRGRTTIPARVVERIAEKVAGEVTHVGANSGGVLGIGARRHFGGNPAADCDVYGRSAVIRLDVGVEFPLPLGEVLTALRSRIQDRIPALTGLEVGRLDVTISWLQTEDTARRLA